jgi:hypothetical protein
MIKRKCQSTFEFLMKEERERERKKKQDYFFVENESSA